MTAAVIPPDEVDVFLSEVETGRLDVERAAVYLAECKTLDQIKDVHDAAKAVVLYFRQRKASLQAQTDAAEIAMRAERRMGELCAAVSGGRGGDRRSSDSVSLGPTLADLGIDKKQSSRWQQLAAIPEDAFVAHVQSVREKGERLTTAGTIRATSDADDYDSDEYYTPEEYIDAARKVMGGIDVDPASCAEAQKTVQASVYFTKEQNGLTESWNGRVFLNMPFSRGHAEAFVEKLLEELGTGRCDQAIVLQNAQTDVGWFHELLAAGASLCLKKGRISFRQPDGTTAKGNRNGQAFFYFGDPEGHERFLEVFRMFGHVGRMIGPPPYLGFEGDEEQEA